MRNKGQHGFDTIKSLLIAAEEGNLEFVSKLTDRGANVNASNNEGITPLMVAARAGNLEVVRKLTDLGANVNASNNEGITPLMLAARAGNLEVVRKLLELNADVEVKDRSEKSSLDYAKNDKIKELLTDQELFKELKKLHEAKDHRGAMEKLFRMSKERARQITNYRDGDGMTILHHAVANGIGFDELQEIVDYERVDIPGLVSHQDNHGMTILHHVVASSIGPEDMQKLVNLLVQKGADVNAKCNNDNTLLHYAAASDIKSRDMEGIVECLVNEGAVVNARNNQGITPLMVAAMAGNLEVVSKLTDLGANVNASNNKGITPLMVAAMAGNSEVVSKLLELNADVEVKDRSEKSSLDYATNDKIKKLLTDHTLNKDMQQTVGDSVEQESSNTSYYAKLFGSVALITLGIVILFIPLPLSPILLAVLVVSFTVVGGIGFFRTFESGMPKEKNEKKFDIIKQFVKSHDFTQVNSKLRDMDDTELKQLIRHKHLDTEKMTLLHLLADHADKGKIKQIVDFLVQKGPYLNKKDIKGRTALDRYNAASMRSRAERYNNEIAKLLTPKTQSKKQSDFYTLISLLRDGKGGAVIDQLQNMDDTIGCCKDGNGITLLHYLAASSINPDDMQKIVELLMEKRADMNARDNITSESPLECAIRHKNVGMATLLEEKGAKIVGIQKNKLTALKEANPQLDPSTGSQVSSSAIP